MSAGWLLAPLAARAREVPGAAALVTPEGRTVTRAELVARADALRRGLAAAGLRPGERVLFAVRPSLDALLLVLAVAECGGVLVPVDAGMGDALFHSRVAQLAPRWVIAESAILTLSARPLLRRLLGRRGLRVPPLAAVPGVTRVRAGRWLPFGPRALSAARLERAAPATEPTAEAREATAEAFLVFTSGTTAAPKVVVHSRRSLQATLELVGGLLAMRPGDVLYARDLHVLLPALFAGATVVLPPVGDSAPDRLLADLARHQVTHLFALPADCQALLDLCTRQGRTLPESLRCVLTGAAPVHVAFLRRFQLLLPPGAQLWCVYGMTEILPVAVVDLAAKLAWAGEGDLLGRPVPGVALRLTDAGELVVRGPHLCTGYLGQAPLVEHETGDLARLTDGNIVLLGRRKDMIIRRDFNLYPALYEPLVERIPGVRRCAFVGVYDEARADELVVLAVEGQPGSDPAALERQVAHALRDGPFRIDEAALPDLVLALPLPTTGRSHKVDKDRLRELARARLACASR